MSEKFRTYKKVWGALGWTAAVSAVLCTLGLIISIILLGFFGDKLVLLGSLCGGFTGGAALFGAAAFFALKRNTYYEKQELDALERADSEDSFFVGEDTLATFGKEGLCIHKAQGRRVNVPYSDLCCISLCSRRAPKEEGEWNVLLKIPAHYFSKDGKRDDVLVMTEAKERLYRCLEKRGLKLLGELPQDRTAKKEKPFERLQTFVLPVRRERRNALRFLLLGAVSAAAGGGLIFLQAMWGALVGVMGVYVAGRALISYSKAKSSVAVYREGIYYSGSDGNGNVFLKWEEITGVSLKEGRGLHVDCIYGAYEFPPIVGAYEYLARNFPGKCAGEGDKG